MPFSIVSNNFDELKNDIRSYVNTKVEFMELQALKKTTQISMRIIKIVFVLIFLLFCLLLASIGGAIYLGEYLENMSLGFFIVGGVHLLLLLIILIFGKLLFRGAIIRNLSFKMIRASKLKI